ncbi:Dynein heavy chain 6, axonemal [Bulinus truncatus]|nr:Dynein heavy chain 6, axonemal [Bulinus truncatus]
MNMKNSSLGDEKLIIGCRPGAKEAGTPEGNREAIYFCVSVIKITHKRVANGVTKLFSTNDLVDNMKKEHVALEPELKQKSADTAARMERLKIDQGKANPCILTEAVFSISMK